MKNVTILMVVTVLFLEGCGYDFPLTKEHNIPIDLAILGLWGPEKKKDLVILKYSDTEYLIHFFTNRDAVYFRGYPIKIGGIACIQLQVIGTDDGPPHPEERHAFAVVSYLLINDELEVRLLNTDLVSKDFRSSEAFLRAFLKYKDNKDLFVEPKRFNRLKD